MKKVFLLLCGGLVVFGANAQYLKPGAVSPDTRISPTKKIAHTAPFIQAPHHTANRTTSVIIPGTTEDFGTGAYSTAPPVNTLPTGWSAGTLSGPGTWHWADYASHGMYGIGVMNSTSASNGWMIFDSDSLGGNGSGSVMPSGWLQSPAYNCTGYSSVRLNFENYYRKFQDSTTVWVGTNPAFTAGTYSVYPVAANDALTTNTASANPSTIHINITGAAANQAAVYIRYVYYAYQGGGGYAWMIDDQNLSTLDPNDVGISGSFMYEPELTAYSGSMFNTPLQFVDSLFPVTQLTNNGSSAQASVAVAAQIFQGTTSVYNHSVSYANLPVSALDSLVQGYPGYLPNAIGNYTCAFSATLAGDADLTNNIDTATFAVTDTTWEENQGDISGGFYCVKTGTSPLTYFNGTRFDVPTTSAGDTVTGFGVVFSSQSLATGAGTVSIQLYSIQQSSTSWTYVATSKVRALTSSDISTSTAAVWAYFGIDSNASGGVAPFILQPGTSYAAMIQVNNVTTTLVVDATPAPNATGFSGYFGQSDTSNNDGATSFGATQATGNTSSVPLVRMYFGHLAHVSAVANVNANTNSVSAYPNPASTEVTVSYNLATAGDVTVTLTDMVGNTVATQQMSNVNSGNAVFNTAALSSGMYLYTVSSNGVRSTGHVVVAH